MRCAAACTLTTLTTTKLQLCSVIGRDSSAHTHTVVAADKAVSKLSPQDPFGPLLCLFHCNIHEAIQTDENACGRWRYRSANR